MFLLGERAGKDKVDTILFNSVNKRFLFSSFGTVSTQLVSSTIDKPHSGKMALSGSIVWKN